MSPSGIGSPGYSSKRAPSSSRTVLTKKSADAARKSAASSPGYSSARRKGSQMPSSNNAAPSLDYSRSARRKGSQMPSSNNAAPSLHYGRSARVKGSQVPPGGSTSPAPDASRAAFSTKDRIVCAYAFPAETMISTKFARPSGIDYEIGLVDDLPGLETASEADGADLEHERNRGD